MTLRSERLLEEEAHARSTDDEIEEGLAPDGEGDHGQLQAVALGRLRASVARQRLVETGRADKPEAADIIWLFEGDTRYVFAGDRQGHQVDPRATVGGPDVPHRFTDRVRHDPRRVSLLLPV